MRSLAGRRSDLDSVSFERDDCTLAGGLDDWPIAALQTPFDLADLRVRSPRVVVEEEHPFRSGPTSELDRVLGEPPPR